MGTAVVFLTLDPSIRMGKLKERETSRYGSELDEAAHREFFAWARGYDDAEFSGRSRARHEAWLALLPCPVLRLDRAEPVPRLVDPVVGWLDSGTVDFWAGRTSKGERIPAEGIPRARAPSCSVRPGMETMTIRAASATSAAEMQAALAAFQPCVVEARGTYTVLVHLGTDAQIVGVLTALQDYVSGRADGGARLDFEGRSYTLHPDPVQPGGW